MESSVQAEQKSGKSFNPYNQGSDSVLIRIQGGAVRKYRQSLPRNIHTFLF
jgi:hypothetical protein